MLHRRWILRNRRNCDSISAELAFFLIANDVRFSYSRLLVELLHLLVVQLITQRLHLLVVQLIIGRLHLLVRQIQIRTLLSQIGTWLHKVRIVMPHNI